MKDLKKISLDGVWYTEGTIHHFAGNDPGGSWRFAIVQFLDEWFNRKEVITAQTSGSTGEPKIIKLSKINMVNSAMMTCSFFELKEKDTALLCLPASHIAGKMMLVRALVAGFDLLTVKPGANPFSDLQTRIDFAAVTPFQLIRSHHTLQAKKIQKLIVGGSPVSQKLQKLIENSGSEIYETYGMTETCSHIALRRLNGRNAEDFFTVLPGIEIRMDEHNCLVIYAPALADSGITTRDVVEMRGKNQFKWLGRSDHAINSGGVKFFPEQIERKLELLLERCYFISSLPDDKLTEKIVLVIEGDRWSESESAQWMQGMKQVLTPFEMPRSIHFIGSFDTTPSGKVLKSEIMRKLRIDGN